MERKDLINEIISFCYIYKLFGRSVKENEIRNSIAHRLEESAFIESLINAIILRTRERKNIDVEKVKEILVELEKLRLELEYSKV